MGYFTISVDGKSSGGTFDVGTQYAVRAKIEDYGGAGIGDYVVVELQHSGKPSIQIGRQRLVMDGMKGLAMAFFWTPTNSQIGSWTIRGIIERNPTYKSSVFYVNIEGDEPAYYDLFAFVRDQNGSPVVGAEIKINDRSSGYTGSDGKFSVYLPAGHYYAVRAVAPVGYSCTDCYESVTLTSNMVVNFTMQGEPTGTCEMQIRPSDQDGMQVDASIEMKRLDTGATQTKRTFSSNYVTFTIDRGKSYQATCTSDRCDTKVDTFTAPDTANSSRIVRMSCVIKPKAAYVTAYVKEDGGDVMVGVNVTLSVSGGKTETKQTAYNGAVSFQILHGDSYTIVAEPPDGYNCECAFCVCSDSGVGDSNYDPKYPFRMSTVEEPEEGEVAVIDSFNHPLKLKKGDNVSVDCVIKNTGTETCELVLRLYDGGGSLIDENPNTTYFTLGAGESVNKNVSTASHPLHNMPDHDITWSIGLDEIQRNDILRRVQKTHDTRPIYIEFEELTETISMDELFGTTRAHTNDNVEATLKATNTGNDTCEVVLRLYDDDTGSLLDENPNLLVFNIEPGESFEHNVSTISHPLRSMPDRDWNLRFELDEFAHIGASVRGAFQKNHYTKRYTVEWVPDDEVIEGELSVNVPSIAMAGTVVLGGTGIAGKRVFIMAKRSWLGFDKLARDTELGSVIIDADNTYEIEVELDDFGIVDVYAKIKEGPSWDNWLGLDLVSSTKTMYVITWTILIALLLGIGLILEKKYNKLGLFKKR